MKEQTQTKLSSLFRGIVVIGALALGAFTNVQAGVLTDIFEMDGDPNAVAGAPSDWEDLYNNGDAVTKIVPIPDRVGLTGFVGPDNMFHHGCKDVNDLLNCYVKAADKTLPDKNDFENGSIALYTLSGLPESGVPIQGLPGGMTGSHQNGDIILVLQGDVYAPNGDASLGGWFFQKQIPAPAPGEAFSVGRTPGDIFIEADFTGGGSDVSFAIYTWDPNAQKNLTQLISGEGLRCGDIENPLGCAISNDETIGPVPTVWDYIAKGDSSPSAEYPTTTFFEGIFNFSAAIRLLGLEMGCYSDFLYETRSSHSIDSKLHDYILGSLPMCDVAVTKDGPSDSKVTDDTEYTITVENTGLLELTRTSINDTVFGDLHDKAATDSCGTDCTVVSNSCGPTLAVDATCTIVVNRTVQEGDSDPLPNTVTAVYSYGTDEVSANDDHSVNLFQPAITLVKTGDEKSKIGDTVDYTITLSNTSSADTPDLECTITDTALGINKNVTLASGENDVTNVSDFTIPEDATDPYINLAEAECSPIGFPNLIPAADNHTIELFQPSVDVVKTGDELSKVGDDVNYSITVTNTSSSDSPDLVGGTIVDNVLGNLLDGANPYVTSNTCTATLAQGASCTILATRTVLESDPDPLPNTVTAHYNPEGFPNDVEATDNHEVNLFQPSVMVAKSGDELSKVGDPVNYVITVTNTSSEDSPDLVGGTITDTVLGNLLSGSNPYVTSSTCSTTLAQGASCTISATRTVLETDADPLPNTVTVHYNPDGFPNDITHSDGHSVNLFQPSVMVAKSGDGLSKAGDPVNYTITVTNNSSEDSPDLVSGTIVDTVLGDLLDGANPYVTSSTCTATLAQGTSCTIEASRTVLEADPDPLPNTVTVHYNPDGFPNDITHSDSHSVELFQPSVMVAKSGDELSKVGDDVNYTITVTNNSSVDSPDLVNGTIVDTVLGNLLDGANPFVTSSTCSATLAQGASCTIEATRTVQESDADPLPNTVTVHYNPDGFPNDITHSDGHSVNLFQPSVEVAKSGDELSKATDGVNYTITVTNTSSEDSPDLVNGTIVDDVLGNLLDGANPYVTSSTCGTTLAQGASCTINATRTVLETDADPLLNTVTVHYNPDGFPNDITHNDSHSVELFQPSVSLAKTCRDPNGTEGDTEVVVGQPAEFVIEVTNGSSDDAPNLELASITDSLLDDTEVANAAASAGCDVLSYGEVCSFSVQYITGEPGTLYNEVSAVYSPADFPNQLPANDDSSCTVVPGNEGCTPGYWKNHPEQWDGVGEDATSSITWNMPFNEVMLGGLVIGATSIPEAMWPMYTGVPNSFTLMDVVNLGGGGLYALDRHAAAALPSSDAVQYSYSTAGVIELYRDAVGAISGSEGVYSALAKLSAANEKYCPLN